MNRLQYEKSPYLLQHMHNPVDWHPWDRKAFEKAQNGNKPIFLSIGYSTCHWCHVMERESFEDEEVARLLNEHFVSIKVDREERPDIDSIYMTVCQAMTGRGGWPLSIFMTPDKKPFLAATYIPKTNRSGMLGMKELIPRIGEMWRTKHSAIINDAQRISNAILAEKDDTPDKSLDKTAIEWTYEHLKRNFEPEYGGFSKKPKFPSPHNLMFLLRHWKRTGREEILNMVVRTLEGMRLGGIFDHLGDGFHRYSTDEAWILPHFEKMLYDQAMLILAYAEAYHVTRKKLFSDTVQDIVEFLKRDMLSPDGAFYSAWDADSEGVEGKFYIWEKSEIVDVLGPEEGRLFCRIFNIKDTGNFRDEATGAPTGENILYLGRSYEIVAEETGMPVNELKDFIESSKKKLFQRRQKRIHPHIDDKILTDWNGLMITALARSYQIFGIPEYLKLAQEACKFISEHLRNRDGSLLHRWRDGEAAIDGFLDDYAFLIWGLIELYEASFNPVCLKEAINLSDDMVSLFSSDRGGFYFSRENSELILRTIDSYDGAIPSGNSVAALNLMKLSRLTGKTEYEDIAENIFAAFSKEVRQTPMAYTYLMTAFDFTIGPATEIIICGLSESADTKDMISTVRDVFLPNSVVLFRPDDKPKEISEISPFTKELRMHNMNVTAHICKDFTCSMPLTKTEEVKETLLNI